ncbi:MAG: hypothetical protein HDS37_03625 [Bacteroides sp.]|nr:hypothetical protein [Bacteroides sp.]
MIYRADADAIDFQNLLKGVFRDGIYEEISYAEAHNLIYGAIEFAEEADIEPYGDFNVAEYILEEDTDKLPLIEYDYGKDGKHVDDMICGDAKRVVSDIEAGNVLSIKEQGFEFPDIHKQ